MAEHTSPVDHFPDMLRHLNNERLLELTRHCARVANQVSADGFLLERAVICRREWERRDLDACWCHGQATKGLSDGSIFLEK